MSGLQVVEGIVKPGDPEFEEWRREHPGIAGAAPPAFVQATGNFLNTAGVTETCTLAGVTAGNLIVVMVYGDSGSLASVSVTDSVGTVYAQDFLANTILAAAGEFVGIFHGLAAAGGSITFTFHSAATTDFRRIIVHEVSGANALDSVNHATGTTTGGLVVSTGAVPVTHTAQEYVVGWMLAENGSSSPVSAGWTNRQTQGSEISIDTVTSATGTATGLATTATTGNTWCGVGASYYLSGSPAFSDVARVSGGGGATVVGRKGSSVALTCSGAVKAAVTGAKGSTRAVTASGGGSTVDTGRKGAVRAVSVSGGGSCSTAGGKGATRTLSVSGAVSSVATGRKGALRALTVSGGGGCSVTSAPVGQAVVSCTGGGGLAVTGRKGALRAVSATLGARVVVTGVKGARGPVSVTGGGSVAVGFSLVAPGIEVHGGGAVTTVGFAQAARVPTRTPDAGFVAGSDARVARRGAGQITVRGVGRIGRA